MPDATSGVDSHRFSVVTDAPSAVAEYLERHHHGLGAAVVPNSWDGSACEVECPSAYSDYVRLTMHRNGWTVDGWKPA